MAGTVLLKAGEVQVQPIGTDSSTYTYFALPNYTADDGVITEGQEGSLTIDSTLFKKSLQQLPDVGFLDHAKCVVMTAKPFEVPPNQQLRVKARVSVQVILPEQLPEGFAQHVRDADDDYRLACGAVMLADLSKGLIAHVILTNKGVWLVHERLAIARSPGDVYRAFTSTFKAASRTSPTEPVDVAMTYDRAAGTLSFYLNGQHTQTLPSIGTAPDPSSGWALLKDLGGADPDKGLDLASVSVAFATLSHLDFADPNDPPSDTGLVQLTAPDGDGRSMYVKPAAFVDAASAQGSRLFGQGARLQVHSYCVELL